MFSLINHTRQVKNLQSFFLPLAINYYLNTPISYYLNTLLVTTFFMVVTNYFFSIWCKLINFSLPILLIAIDNSNSLFIDT